MSSQYRYTSPVGRKQAHEPVASIYAQISRDFLLADGPLMVLSPDSNVLAATWALLREAQLASGAPREITELIAIVVSQANACAFCVDAHTMLLHATGAHTLAEAAWHGRSPGDSHHEDVIEWAHATAHPERGISAPPGSVTTASAYIGTALVTHFINRITSALLNESLLPGRLQTSSFVRRTGGRAMSRKVKQDLVAGDSLRLIQNSPEYRNTESAIFRAITALRDATRQGGKILEAESRETVTHMVRTVERNDIEAHVTSVADGDRAGARLALLAALNPQGITDENVALWRETHPDDVSLIRLVAWGAMLRVDQIAEHLLSPAPAATH